MCPCHVGFHLRLLSGVAEGSDRVPDGFLGRGVEVS